MRLLFTCFSVLLLAACSGQSLEQDGGDLTRGEVEFLSARMRTAIEKEYPVLKHKMVSRYVDNLGQAIVSHNAKMPPLAYEFRVLKSNEVFHFSLPGGIVYISLGLLRAVDMEGQLAAALSHELAHQQLNHTLIVWRRKVNANRGQRYLLDFSGEWKRTFLGKNGALTLDKGMEEEADRLGPVIVYNDRFDPRLYLSFLQLLKKLEAADLERVATLLSLHPPLESRINWVRDALVKLPPLKDANLSSPTFQQIKAILKEAEKKAEDKRNDDE